MKPNRDAAALAAALTSAANTPLPLPERPPMALVASADEPLQPGQPRSKVTPQKAHKPKPAETVGITLRPSAELLNRYTLAAAERTKKEGKVISAQQIMLEVLEREMKVKS